MVTSARISDSCAEKMWSRPKKATRVQKYCGSCQNNRVVCRKSAGFQHTSRIFWQSGGKVSTRVGFFWQTRRKGARRKAETGDLIKPGRFDWREFVRNETNENSLPGTLGKTNIGQEKVSCPSIERNIYLFPRTVVSKSKRQSQPRSNGLESLSRNRGYWPKDHKSPACSLAWFHLGTGVAG